RASDAHNTLTAFRVCEVGGGGCRGEFGGKPQPYISMNVFDELTQGGAQFVQGLCCCLGCGLEDTSTRHTQLTAINAHADPIALALCTGHNGLAIDIIIQLLAQAIEGSLGLVNYLDQLTQGLIVRRKLQSAQTIVDQPTPTWSINGT